MYKLMCVKIRTYTLACLVVVLPISSEVNELIKKMISYILSFAIAASMAASCLTASAANMTGSCTADVLNVRSGAGTGYSKTGTVSLSLYFPKPPTQAVRNGIRYHAAI